jgi:hypothetical protein
VLRQLLAAAFAKTLMHFLLLEDQLRLFVGRLHQAQVVQ